MKKTPRLDTDRESAMGPSVSTGGKSTKLSQVRYEKAELATDQFGAMATLTTLYNTLDKCSHFSSSHYCPLEKVCSKL